MEISLDMGQEEWDDTMEIGPEEQTICDLSDVWHMLVAKVNGVKMAQSVWETYFRKRLSRSSYTFDRYEGILHHWIGGTIRAQIGRRAALSNITLYNKIIVVRFYGIYE